MDVFSDQNFSENTDLVSALVNPSTDPIFDIETTKSTDIEPEFDTVYVKTLGCKVNTFDSHAIENQFKAVGFRLVDDLCVSRRCLKTSASSGILPKTHRDTESKTIS